MARLLIALALTLAGCAAKGPYGNFAGALPIDDHRMADDTAKQLAVLFPPASTRLKLDQPASDAYGSALVEKLRKAGYAVAVRPEIVPIVGQSALKAWQAVPGTDLHYVVDQLGGGKYLVSVQVGGQTLSRAYQAANHRLAAAGYWARKE